MTEKCKCGEPLPDIRLYVGSERVCIECFEEIVGEAVDAPPRPVSWVQKGCECVGCRRERAFFAYIEHLEALVEALEDQVLYLGGHR